jgi:serine/threonine protein kinase
MQENVLLKKIGTDDSGLPLFEPKIADFGMAADDEAATATTPPDGTVGTSSSVKDAAWTGTYLYMSPEATGLNADTGYPKGHIALKLKKDTGQDDPLFGASDTFSFGVMLFIMMTREARWFESDGLELPTIINKQGKPAEDMKTLARWYFNGKRPQFKDSFPPLLRLLIEGCWADRQSDRLRFVDIEALLKNGEIDWLAAAPEPEAAYDEWLERVGVKHKRDELYEYDVREGKGPLEKLVELLTEEEEDFAEMLEDLFRDDAETQAMFRAEVQKLVEASSGSEISGGHASFKAAVHAVLAISAFAEVAQDATAKQKLLALLPKSELAQKDEQLAQKDKQLAQKDKQLAEQVAALARLQAQLDNLTK